MSSQAFSNASASGTRANCAFLSAFLPLRKII